MYEIFINLTCMNRTHDYSDLKSWSQWLIWWFDLWCLMPLFGPNEVWFRQILLY